MREITTDIEISADPQQVWDVLMDFERWPDWNPIVSKVVGRASLDYELIVSMKNESGGEGPKYMPLITVFEPPKLFHWRAKMIAGFLFTNDKVFELEGSGEGTRLIHKELFSGLLVPMLWGKMEQGVPKMLQAMNEALKDCVEGKND